MTNTIKPGGSGSGREPHPPELGLVDGLDLHARYHLDRTGGDFFDAVRVGTRVAFLLSDIAGRRETTDPIAAATQDAFRAKATELFAAGDANLTEGTEMLVQTINMAIITAASGGICFAPTMLGCYDAQIGVLAYINAGGQTAMLRDSEGTRPLPNASLPLGLTTHMPYEASMQAFEPGREASGRHQRSHAEHEWQGSFRSRSCARSTRSLRRSARRQSLPCGC